MSDGLPTNDRLELHLTGKPITVMIDHMSARPDLQGCAELLIVSADSTFSLGDLTPGHLKEIGELLYEFSNLLISLDAE